MPLDALSLFNARAEQKENFGQSFDVDNWTGDVEDGFPRFDKISPELKEHYWGQGRKNRPRFKELNEQADAVFEEGYRVLELFPDRDNKDESYLIFGTPSELRIQASLIINLRRMHANFLAGQGWLGYPFEEYLRSQARNHLSLTVVLLTNPHGIAKKTDWGEKYWSKRQISIPHVDRAKLTYSALRKACGDKAGLKFGEWQARAWVSLDDDDKQHQMVCSGTTDEGAKQNLKRFLPFTKCKLRNMTATKLDFTEGERSKDHQREDKKNFQIYAAWCFVKNKQMLPTAAMVPSSTAGRNTNNGRRLQKNFKLPLFKPNEPADWKEQLKDAFRSWDGRLLG